MRINARILTEMHLLEVKNLHVEVEGKNILNGLDLKVGKGSVHAIMGPNGSGKSTLAHVLAGKADYVVTQGEVLLDGEDILAHRAQRAAQEARRGRALGAGVRQARERGRGQARYRKGHAASRRQCRL